jgi:hypothetical protein
MDRPFEALDHMLDLRRKIAPVESDRHLAEEWPPRSWFTPEAVILVVCHGLKVLKSDGLSEEAALRKIDGLLQLSLDASREPDWRLLPYLKRWLGRGRPEYAGLGEALLNRVIGIAQASAKEALANDGGGWPPADWCKRTLSRADFERAYLSRRKKPQDFRSFGSIEFTRFLLRLRDGDEIKAFSSPPETWRLMMGRAGIAIVRNGRAVMSLMTMMN